MNRKNRIIIAVCVAVTVLVSFFTGAFVGSSTDFFKKSKHKKSRYISFYSVKKHLGKEMDKAEKQAMRMFIVPYEECFRNDLNEEEKKAIKDVQLEVTDMAKENTKIKFRINELKAYQNNVNIAKTAVKKTRKCQKYAYKHMTKTDRRLFRGGLSKLSIDNVIAIFHGVR